MNETLELQFYIFFWESFNKCENIEDFRSKVQERYLDLEYEERLFFASILKKFYNYHNIQLETTENNLFYSESLTNTKENLYNDTLLKIIKNNKIVLIDDEEDKDLRYIVERNFQVLKNQLEAIPLKERDKEEMLKESLSKAFSFSVKNYIIEMEESKISIKHSPHKSPLELDMEHIYSQQSPDYYSRLIDGVVVKVLQGEINFHMIDNIYFHQNYVEFFKEYIKKEIKDDENIKSDLLNHFANYLFNKYKDTIHGKIIDKILALVVDKHSNVSKFINFYNGQPTKIEDLTVQKPKLESQGKLWTYNAVLEALQKIENFKDESGVDFERNSRIIKKMEERLAKLVEKRDRMTKEESDSEEYRKLIIDIDFEEKNILHRKHSTKVLTEEEIEKKAEFDKLSKNKEVIKKAFMEVFEDFII
ncbi:MAG: hypothetical protein OIF32_08680 [Campylobacterales bacterium]|nr:hypothetical protein [Campylobacterales bacterium]